MQIPCTESFHAHLVYQITSLSHQPPVTGRFFFLMRTLSIKSHHPVTNLRHVLHKVLLFRPGAIAVQEQRGLDPDPVEDVGLGQR